MENKNGGDFILQFLIVVAGLMFLCFSCYSLYFFWRQELIARELETWQPVVATDYEIKQIQKPYLFGFRGNRDTASVQESAEVLGEYDTARLGEVLEKQISANKRKKAAGEASLAGLSLGIYYAYEFEGFKGDGFLLSPFPELNWYARLDKQLYSSLLRTDHPPLTVYVDPDQPTRSALVNSWAQGDRWLYLLLGGIFLPISLVLLYYVVRPVPRVEKLLNA